jgi:hypothetical protein
MNKFKINDKIIYAKQNIATIINIESTLSDDRYIINRPLSNWPVDKLESIARLAHKAEIVIYD